ncbi:phage tail tip lysozyme [Rhizobium calliandrae]|uniref:Phage tail tip lysozyme n=1 Tax=Rhizobium calliandrae TaxID=1312182 RepID=A0ABT7KMW1_9HYPH|nr:phage tail tip lysozyme [Rhizobium calliandrae]MDL2409965.1 phage tail tip lysozyme [Rhizobium calliandrae]
MSVAKLKELQQVASGLAIDPDSIASGMSFSAQNADAMRLRQGNYGAIAGLRGGGKAIAEDLANTKSNDEVFEKELGYIAKQKDAQSRRVLGQLFFNNPDFAEFGANGIGELNRRRAEARENVQVFSENETKNAQAFQDAISHLSADFENLKNSVGGELAPQIIAAADAFKEFSDAHVADVKEFFHDVSEDVRQVDWKGVGSDVQTVFKNLKDGVEWVESLTNWKAINPPKPEDRAKDSESAKPGQYYQSKSGLLIEKGGTLDKFLEAVPNPFSYVAPKNTTSKDDKVLPPPQDHPEAHGYGGMAKPIAYHPGMQSAFVGASAARNSAAIAVLTKGVELGMIAFTQSYLGGGAAPGIGGGEGFQNVSYGGGRAVFGGGGTGGEISAESIRAVHAKGNLSKNQQEAYAALIAGGLSREAARASVANMSGEALSDPGNVHWDGTHYAHGIVQWDDVRSQRIKNQFGKFPQQMSVTDQVKAFLWETKKYYSGVWEKLNSDSSAESMVDTLVRKYELPGNPNKAISQRLGFLRGLPDFKQDVPERRSTAKASGAIKPPEAAKPQPNGRLDVIVTSKEQPVNVKASDSDLFQSLKINRGNAVSL